MRRASIGVDNDQFFEARHRHALPKTEVILAQALAAGGYRTGFFGKWHCGECPDYYPDDRGFHVAKGYRTQAVSTSQSGHWMTTFHKYCANLAMDPEEQDNLAVTNAQMRDKLIRQLDRSLRDMKAEMPVVNPDFKINTKGKRKNLKFTKDLAEKERREFESRLKK